MENMDMETIVTIALLGAVVIYASYRFFRFGGVVGMLYGKRHEEIGCVDLKLQHRALGLFGSSKVCVHRLEPDAQGQDGDVALVFRSRSGTSFSITTHRLDAGDVNALVELLRSKGSKSPG